MLSFIEYHRLNQKHRLVEDHRNTAIWDVIHQNKLIEIKIKISDTATRQILMSPYWHVFVEAFAYRLSFLLSPFRVLHLQFSLLTGKSNDTQLFIQSVPCHHSSTYVILPSLLWFQQMKNQMYTRFSYQFIDEMWQFNWWTTIIRDLVKYLPLACLVHLGK